MTELDAERLEKAREVMALDQAEQEKQAFRFEAKQKFKETLQMAATEVLHQEILQKIFTEEERQALQEKTVAYLEGPMAEGFRRSMLLGAKAMNQDEIPAESRALFEEALQETVAGVRRKFQGKSL